MLPCRLQSPRSSSVNKIAIQPRTLLRGSLPASTKSVTLPSVPIPHLSLGITGHTQVGPCALCSISAAAQCQWSPSESIRVAAGQLRGCHRQAAIGTLRGNHRLPWQSSASADPAAAALVSVLKLLLSLCVDILRTQYIRHLEPRSTVSKHQRRAHHALRGRAGPPRGSSGMTVMTTLAVTCHESSKASQCRMQWNDMYYPASSKRSRLAALVCSTVCRVLWRSASVPVLTRCKCCCENVTQSTVVGRSFTWNNRVPCPLS
jgi:hypothetical protein